MKKPLFSFSGIVKLGVLGIIIGSVAGFAVPFTTGYVIPKLEQNKNEVIEDMENSQTTPIEADAVASNASLDEASKNTIALIKKVKPSVVCITTTTQGQTWFNQIYESEGAGSGVIFHEDENNIYIVTNAHVISGASKVMLSVSESDLVSASLVGKDANADLAVLSVTKADLKTVGITGVTVAEFGGSDLQVGESVIAIGNALGEGNTATAGIVSAVSKDVNIQGRKLTVVQTDAAINPGNSGGALINSKGQVIGINTAKLAITEVEGIGYAIASNVAKPIIEQLMNSTDTPALGVYITNISEEVAQAYNLPQAGVMIESVIKGGSAANAGLREGDIITAFNDTPVFTSEQLLNIVKQQRVGDSVKITVIRDGKTVEINVKLQKTGF